MQIRCNFPDISYLSETQKNNFQFLSNVHLKANNHIDVTSKVGDHVKFDAASPFLLVYLCQHQNKKNVMSTIMNRSAG